MLTSVIQHSGSGDRGTAVILGQGVFRGERESGRNCRNCFKKWHFNATNKLTTHYRNSCVHYNLDLKFQKESIIYPKVTIFLLFSAVGKPLKTATTTASGSKAVPCLSSLLGRRSPMMLCVRARGELCLLPDWELPGEPSGKKQEDKKHESSLSVDIFFIDLFFLICKNLNE